MPGITTDPISAHHFLEKTTPGITKDRDLTVRAFRILEDMMRAYDNILSPKHREALFALVSGYTHLATGFKTGRFGYPLPCGGGKTVSAIAWCAANWEMQKGHSVLICQNQLSELCQLKQSLIDRGIPDEQIGILHSVKSLDDKKGIGFLSTEDNDDRQYLLISHARAQGKVKGSDPEVDLTYNGTNRSLVIYDESLMISDKWSLTIKKIVQAHNDVLHELKYSCGALEEKLKPVEEWLGMCAKKIEREFFRQKRHRKDEKRKRNAKPMAITISTFRHDDLSERLGGSLKEHEYTLAELQRFSMNKLRVVIDTDKGAAVFFEPTFPKSFDAVAVLDASIPIRHLATVGGKLKIDPVLEEIGEVKSYEDTTIHHLVHPSGRESMEKLFSVPKSDRRISKEIAEVIKSLPSNEGVLITVFKQKGTGPDFEEVLRSDFRSLGIDPDEVIFADPELVERKKPNTKIAFMTWGQEIGTNKFAHYQNEIIVGTYFKPHYVTAREMVGELQDLEADLSDFRSVALSEMRHSVYQCMNRCRMRVMDNGKALLSKVWIICSQADLEEYLGPVLPDARWQPWVPTYLDAKGHTIEDATKVIVEHLNGLPERTTQVSSRQLKLDTELDRVAETTFRIARDRALERSKNWAFEGRSFVRAT